jgi:teichuronic acid biosynthesis glycosyltransferase TuaH
VNHEPLAGDWRGLVVVCGGTPWDGMVSTPKEIAVRLARSRPVLYVDPPVSPLSAARRGVPSEPISGPRLRPAGERIARLSPVVQPGIDRPGLARVTELLVKRQMRAAVRRLGADVDAVVVANQRALLGACGERRKIVYATDDFVAGAHLLGVRRGVLQSQQRRQARVADVVVCVTDELARTWRDLRVTTAVVPNGCDAEAYARVDDVRPAPDVTLPKPIAGFLGHVSERIDVALLDAVAASGASLLIVGPRPASSNGNGLARLLARPNVQWIPERPPAAMPSYLRLIDVGLTPYADTAFNRASFPLKTLEYLAAGRRVVATGLPATKWLATDLVSVADTPDAFAAAVGHELRTPATDADVDARRAFARRHSWDVRTAEIERILAG